MWNEFKKFLMRGNVLDLAIGVIIGAAFTAVVTSVVTNLITPLIGIFTQSVNVADLKFTIGKTVFAYGNVINTIITFVITGFVLFVIVKAINKFVKKTKEEAQVDTELSLLTEIRDELKAQKNSSKK